jgi:Asp-tRNA(Asn)/Glu-tRNA(Gln) amidotransferase A subunit family amidase
VAETARSLARERAGGEERLSPRLREVLAAGDAVTADAHRAALDRAAGCRGELPRVFAEVDALLTPSVAGEAPATLESTGDPAFNRIWTVLHLPCMHLPVGLGPAGLPLGVQLVGGPGGDGALLGMARWAEARVRGA